MPSALLGLHLLRYVVPPEGNEVVDPTPRRPDPGARSIKNTRQLVLYGPGDPPGPYKAARPPTAIRRARPCSR